MHLFFASDHAGFELKSALVACARERGYDVADLGAYEYEHDDDYPEIVARAAERVSKDPSGSKAIILGGSGQGEAIVANRFPNVRAVVYNGESRGAVFNGIDEIRLSREHNDANVLSLGARFLNENEARAAMCHWLETPFTNDPRHMRRIAAIEKIPVRTIL